MGSRLTLPRQNATIKFFGHLLNPANRQVETKEGKTKRLTKIELEVLLDLLEANGEVVERREFTPWRGKETNPNRHPVDMHISALKRKLSKELIASVPGVGHSLSSGIKVEVLPQRTLSKAAVFEDAAVKHTDTHAGRDLLAAIKNCDDRIEMGQATAETYVMKARACLNAGHEGFCLMPWREAAEKARAAIADALARDGRSSSAYAMRGLLAHSYDYAWQKADEDLSTSLALDPNSHLAHVFYAHLLVSRGDLEEGLKHIRRGAELAPTDRITVSTECWMLVLAGQPHEAIKKGIEVRRLFPSFAQARIFLGWAYQADGDVDQAIEEYRTALEGEFLPEGLASLGNAYAQVKQDKSALATLQELKEAKAAHKIAYVSAYSRAVVLAGFGNRKMRECLDALERAFMQRSSWLVYLNVDPRWDLFRQKPRFMDLVRRVGLKPPEKPSRSIPQ